MSRAVKRGFASGLNSHTTLLLSLKLELHYYHYKFNISFSLLLLLFAETYCYIISRWLLKLIYNYYVTRKHVCLRYEMKSLNHVSYELPHSILMFLYYITVFCSWASPLIVCIFPWNLLERMFFNNAVDVLHGLLDINFSNVWASQSAMSSFSSRFEIWLVCCFCMNV